MTTMSTGQNEEMVTSENGGSKSGSELSRLRNRVIELENYLKKQVTIITHCQQRNVVYHSLCVLLYSLITQQLESLPLTPVSIAEMSEKAMADNTARENNGNNTT